MGVPSSALRGGVPSWTRSARRTCRTRPSSSLPGRSCGACATTSSRCASSTGRATTTGRGPRASSTRARRSRRPPREVAEETASRWCSGPAARAAVPHARGPREARALLGRAPGVGPVRRRRARRARPVPPVSPQEIDRAAWLSTDDAARRLTRQADRAPLEALVRERDEGRLATHVVVIARHGKAVARSAWHGDEQDRPLTPAGHAQGGARAGARGLRRRDDRHEPLGPLRPDDRALRDRLRPRHGQHRPPHRGAARAVPARVARTVRELLEAERSSVLCTHRPVLPTVLDVLGQHSRRPVANALPAHDPFLEPGEMIVATWHARPRGRASSRRRRSPRRCTETRGRRRRAGDVRTHDGAPSVGESPPTGRRRRADRRRRRFRAGSG